MAFEGFDLGLKDKYNNCLCVGDNIKDIFFIDGQITEYKGQIVYSPKLYCFVVQWENEDEDIIPLFIMNEYFWKGVEKCAKP